MPIRINLSEKGPEVYLDDALMGGADHRSSVGSRLSFSIPQTLYLLCSPLLGWGIENFLRNKPDSSLVVFVELHPELHQLFAHSESVFSTLKPQSFVIAPCAKPQNIGDYLQEHLAHSQIRKVQLLSLSRAFRLCHDSYRALESLMQERVSSKWQNRMTAIGLSRRWIKNLFTNLAQPSFPLQYSHPQAPVVVAGAGPRAEDTLKNLAPFRNRFILIATDSSLPHLAEIALRPDLIICQDAQYWNMRDLVPFHWAHSPLLCDLVSFPPMVRKMPTHAYFLSQFADISLLQRVRASKNIALHVEALGSVGVTACRIAMELSRGFIILTGMDFLFTAGQSHLRMTAAHRLQLSQSSRLFPDPTVPAQLQRPHSMMTDRSQQAVKVDFVYAGYARTLSRLTQAHARVLDSRTDGLPITARSMAISSLQRLLEGYEELKEPHCISIHQNPPAYDLLQNECRKLESFLHSPQSDLLERELDYLTLDFPDRHTAKTQDMMSRARLSAADYTAHLKRLATGSHHREKGRLGN